MYQINLFQHLNFMHRLKFKIYQKLSRIILRNQVMNIPQNFYFVITAKKKHYLNSGKLELVERILQ